MGGSKLALMSEFCKPSHAFTLEADSQSALVKTESES